MRNIGRLDDAAQARIFSDLLFSRGVANDVRPADGDHAIWVHDDARVDESKALMAEYKAEPGAERFKADAASGKARRAETRRKDDAYRDRVKAAQASLYGVHGRGWVTMTMLALSVLVAVVSQLGMRTDKIPFLFFTLMPADFLLPEIQAGQVWRLVTPVFVHFGIWHILFNMWMWWSWGQLIEVRKGLKFFLPLVLASAVASNTVQWGWTWLTEPHSVALFGGMSGVLYALFGYAYMKGRIDPADQISVPENTSIQLIGWLFLCMTGFMGSIANGAHVGGLIFGGLWAYVDVAWFRWNKNRMRR
jgi:GlpG protein